MNIEKYKYNFFKRIILNILDKIKRIPVKIKKILLNDIPSIFIQFIFSSYFIQHITNGGAFVDKTMYCSQISDLISSIIIYLCGFVFFIKYTMNYLIDKNEEKQAIKAKANTQEGGDK